MTTDDAKRLLDLIVEYIDAKTEPELRAEFADLPATERTADAIASDVAALLSR